MLRALFKIHIFLNSIVAIGCFHACETGMLFKICSDVFFLLTLIATLLTGDNECGKTTLVAKLQCNEDPKKGSGLEYAYIDVRDEYRDGEAFEWNGVTTYKHDVLM